MGVVLCALLCVVLMLGTPVSSSGATLVWGGGVPLLGAHTSVAPSTEPSLGAIVASSTQVVGTADFQVGDDYTQNSHLAGGGNPMAVASAQGLLSSMGTFQNVALMGWGAGDPEPSPGDFQWGSLDDRVEAMADTVPAGQEMITLCTAPGWMKVGGASQEWNMDAAVAPSYYEDFALLSAATALRYDGTHRDASGRLLPKVDYFDVWNELKGFWDATTDTWNAEAYTTMYNDVYAAIKAVRPDARIGGPYAPLGATTSPAAPGPPTIDGQFGDVDPRALNAISYWMEHMVGAQFVSVDGGPAATDESGFAGGQYFSAVTHWLRLQESASPNAASLPIFWAEFYPALQSTDGTATGQEAVAIDVSDIVQAAQAGANNLLLWEMEGNAAGTSPSTGESVWTDTALAGGGRPTGLYDALITLSVLFPPGTALYATAVAGPVTAMAGANGTLLVSQSPDDLTVSVNGDLVTMSPYAVMVAP